MSADRDPGTAWCGSPAQVRAESAIFGGVVLIFGVGAFVFGSGCLVVSEDLANGKQRHMEGMCPIASKCMVFATS